MKVVLQRVSSASVSINNNVVGAIDHGLVILLGIHSTDTLTTIDWMVNKITNLRIFNDAQALMNKSLMDVNGSCLVISQFTLYGDAQKGNRPSFIQAARPEVAIPIYESFKQKLQATLATTIACGEFGADMQVALVNDGPVTIVIEK